MRGSTSWTRTGRTSPASRRRVRPERRASDARPGGPSPRPAEQAMKPNRRNQRAASVDDRARREGGTMKWLVLVALVVLAAAAVVVLAAGCGSNESGGAKQQSAESTTAASETTTASSSTSTPAIVGRWKRALNCPEVVKAVDDAGLGAIAPSVVAEYFPGISS